MPYPHLIVGPIFPPINHPTQSLFPLPYFLALCTGHIKKKCQILFVTSIPTPISPLRILNIRYSPTFTHTLSGHLTNIYHLRYTDRLTKPVGVPQMIQIVALFHSSLAGEICQIFLSLPGAIFPVCTSM